MINGNDTPTAASAMHAVTAFTQVSVNELSPEEAVSRLLEEATTLQVSDLFFSTNDNHVAVSVRHLGVLRLFTIMPLELGRRCMARIKAVAGMDTIDSRHLLDGRWIHELKKGGQNHLRISTLPTLYGEDLSLRFLPGTAQFLALEGLGLLRHDLNQLLSLLNSPSGLILVTGWNTWNFWVLYLLEWRRIHHLAGNLVPRSRH